MCRYCQIGSREYRDYYYYYLFIYLFFLERVFEYSLGKTDEYSKPEKWYSGQP